MSGVDILSLITQAHQDSALTEVKVPELGTSLWFKPLTLAQRSEIRKGTNDDEEMVLAKTLIVKALDATGKRVFEDDAKTLATIYGKMDVVLLRSILSRASQKPLEVDEAKNA
jgi:hypothetical protein